MALIFDQNANTPQTHMLIIGVGGYRYLKDGVEEKQQTQNHLNKLKQLTSPPRSAIAFKDQFLQYEQDGRLAQPLGTIEMLISTAPDDQDPDPGNGPFEPATLDNIINAYFAWKNRCNQNPDNVAIFFFSGHGLEKQEHYLLAEDFGKIPQNPWTGGFSFNKTRRAFHDCQAKTQCFFIDSCRIVKSEMLLQDLPDNPIEPPSYLVADCQHDLTMKAAAHNEAALGPKKKPSYFTQALLKALDGGAAKKRNNQWVVETGRIGTEINNILKLVKESEGYRQRCTYTSSEPAPLVFNIQTPKALLSISCDPEVANNEANFSCQEPGSANILQRGPQPEPWQLELDAGIYQVTATFNGNQYNDVDGFHFLEPPITPAPLEC